MDKIKNIILDLGGVLYDLDYEKTQEEFAKLGMADQFSKLNQEPLFDDIEEGKISKEDFINTVISNSPVKVEAQDVIDAWNIMLLGMPAHRLDLLKRLAKNYRLFLYSNTNAIHIEEVYNSFQRDLGIPNLDAFFEEVYLSNELGIRKPKPDGFIHIVDENGLLKEETLFIDDSPQHVEGARKAGIKAEWLKLEEESIEGMLLRLGIKN